MFRVCCESVIKKIYRTNRVDGQGKSDETAREWRGWMGPKRRVERMLSRKMCKDRYVLICISFFSLLGVARACRRIGGKEGLEELGEAWMAGMGVEIALRKIVTGG